jgi:hypothetical protein
MMQASKILLSKEELRLAENADWILTKNGIIQKIISLFGSVAESFRDILIANTAALPEEVFSFSPKISRGEQYLGLPYVMLDYPRIFSRENVFAIRTFFWWGNYFSLTLHLKGTFKNNYQQKLQEHFSFLATNGFSIAVSEDEWRHDFTDENYMRMSDGFDSSQKNQMKEKEFLKVAVKWPLKESHQIQLLLETQYANLLKVVCS